MVKKKVFLTNENASARNVRIVRQILLGNNRNLLVRLSKIPNGSYMIAKVLSMSIIRPEQTYTMLINLSTVYDVHVDTSVRIVRRRDIRNYRVDNWFQKFEREGIKNLYIGIWDVDIAYIYHVGLISIFDELLKYGKDRTNDRKIGIRL